VALVKQTTSTVHNLIRLQAVICLLLKKLRMNIMSQSGLSGLYTLCSHPPMQG